MPIVNVIMAWPQDRPVAFWDMTDWTGTAKCLPTPPGHPGSSPSSTTWTTWKDGSTKTPGNKAAPGQAPWPSSVRGQWRRAKSVRQLSAGRPTHAFSNAESNLTPGFNPMGGLSAASPHTDTRRTSSLIWRGASEDSLARECPAPSSQTDAAFCSLQVAPFPLSTDYSVRRAPRPPATAASIPSSSSARLSCNQAAACPLIAQVPTPPSWCPFEWPVCGVPVSERPRFPDAVVALVPHLLVDLILGRPPPSSPPPPSSALGRRPKPWPLAGQYNPTQPKNRGSLLPWRRHPHCLVSCKTTYRHSNRLTASLSGPNPTPSGAIERARVVGVCLVARKHFCLRPRPAIGLCSELASSSATSLATPFRLGS
ncbi:hypothetical protein PCL_03631 [Purpureocillium lilacinum]|uniref:Uncharacterized protein n=1 Tax=Purpureocillium lilacinum TaxID=33203 RepID=A0A2U3EPJ6_PURLI|nr:hypothetical protein PCL_03631 [Purpureocillium lilacinum]